MSQHHPVPGYGQPPHQPYPAAPPPGGPPLRSRQLTVPLWAVIVAGVVGLCVLGGGIAVAVTLATDSGPAGQPAAVTSPSPAPTTTSGPPDPATSGPSTPDDSNGPIRLPVGEGAENDTGRLTVTDAQRFTEPDSRLGEPPENEFFLQITVHAEAVGEQVYAVSAYDFYVRDSEGRRYDSGGGNALFAITEHTFGIAELNPGEQATGDIAFDVPAGPLELVFAPNYGRSQVIWEIP